MARSVTEVDLILRALPIEQLVVLNNLKNNEKEFKIFCDVLIYVLNNDKDKILKAAGGISSVDSAIENITSQSFFRGRIASMVLIRSLIINANKEIIRREAKNG